MRGSGEALMTLYDVGLLDLDGVVYLGAEALPGVADVLGAAARAGMRFGYVTNNAARTPAQVGEHLRALGIPATDDEVITSPQAAARVLAAKLPSGSPVLIIGTAALAAEVENVGLHAVWSAAESPVAVVQGYNPDLSSRMLAEACAAIHTGAWWVATNTDLTLPSVRGPMPGNGSFVGVVAQTTGALAVVAGKPEPAMHQECLVRTRAQRPLVVGDRLDTDIEGANRVGVPSLLVLTGSTRAAELLAAAPPRRPTYVAEDLSGLLHVHPEVDSTEVGARCGGWQVLSRSDHLVLQAETQTGPDSSTSVPDRGDALRALVVTAWSSGITRVIGGDGAADSALDGLGLANRD